MKKAILALIIACTISCNNAQAFFLKSLVGIALKPVTIPLNLARKLVFKSVSKTASIGVNAGKKVLTNVSVSTGPVKIRPFDFQ